eukprot:TRINITY_DN3746_c0_g1_i2.p1 TRINITY_DN3746_c0_g1~~TRINITY_DN3746_c0_g1_i2.p1  ORF type:complete len:1335 (+),score=253.87 TRINITY_DN3746_c0_g1_i2:87-4007(+)
MRNYAGTVSGVMTFANTGSNITDVAFNITGLSDGSHALLLRSFGNVFEPSGWGSNTPDNLEGKVVVSAASTAVGSFQLTSWVWTNAQNYAGKGLYIFSGNSTSSTAIGQCALGKAVENAAVQVIDTTAAIEWVCALRENSALPALVRGYIMFVLSTPWKINFALSGLPPADYNIGISQSGDVQHPDFASISASGLFNGSCVNCRPAGMQQAVGLIDNGTPYRVSASNVVLGGAFTDANVRSVGANAVPARACMVYRGSQVFAAGVIAASMTLRPGATATGTAVPLMIEGVAVLQSNLHPEIQGILYFEQLGTNFLFRLLVSGVAASTEFRLIALWDADDLADRFAVDPAQIAYSLATLTSDGTGTITAQYYSTKLVAGQRVVLYSRQDVEYTEPLTHGVVGAITLIANASSERATVVSQASCVLRPIINTTSTDPPVFGYVFFSEPVVGGGTQISYAVGNLRPNQSHAWSINSKGDMRSYWSGSLASSRFVGSPTPGRPVGPDEVGSLGNGLMLSASSTGVATGTFVDAYISLMGRNTVIGRSIVVALGNSSSLVSQCVISEWRTPNISVLVPHVTRAVCSISPTGSSGVSGTVIFETLFPDGPVRLSHSLAGISTSFTLRVAEFGDIRSADASTAGPVFVGSYAVRQGGQPGKVGLVADGLVRTSSVAASGDLVDTQLRLNGPDSIVGRSLLVQDTAGRTSGVCVIGRAEESTAVPAEDMPTITSASCVFDGTASSSIRGVVTFELANQPALESVRCAATNLSCLVNTSAVLPIWVSYQVQGLSNNVLHGMHVHTLGNLTFTGSHFVGNCSQCRPTGQPQEIGLLLDGRLLSIGSDGVASGRYPDYAISFNGPNGILGRAVVIHGSNSSASVRVAQCVIGATKSAGIYVAPDVTQPISGSLQTKPAVPFLTRAVAIVRSSSSAWGHVTLLASSDGLDSTINFVFFGLKTGQAYSLQLRKSASATSTVLELPLLAFCTGATKPTIASQTGLRLPAVDSAGHTRGSVVDCAVRINGGKSVIGRTLVLLGSSGAVVGSGVIARAQEDTRGQGSSINTPPIFQLVDDAVVDSPVAVCKMHALGDSGASGSVEFSLDASAASLTAFVKLSGLAPGSYQLSVSSYGDETNTADGSSAGDGFPAAAGQLIGSAADTVVAPGASSLAASGRISLTLTGSRGILGRGIVLTDGAGARVGMCAVGIADPVPEPSKSSSVLTQTGIIIIAATGGGLVLCILLVLLVLLLRRRGCCSRRQKRTKARARPAPPAGKPNSKPLKALGVLPPNWEEAISESGDVYYYNSFTGEVRWDAPT